MNERDSSSSHGKDLNRSTAGEKPRSKKQSHLETEKKKHCAGRRNSKETPAENLRKRGQKMLDTKNFE